MALLGLAVTWRIWVLVASPVEIVRLIGVLTELPAFTAASVLQQELSFKRAQPKELAKHSYVITQAMDGISQAVINAIN